ncbi:MAG: GNAT family N-acetyltransferase [Actinomycetia bacterium]|nr:GNAT family N-acetyltransferase [Actinomycetes bacterium]
MVEYRQATVEDIEAVIDLRLAFAKEYFGPMDAGEELAMRNHYRDFLKRKLGDSFISLLAFSDGQAVATASLLIDERPVGNRWPNGWHATVFNVYTDPAFRKLGHAAQLCKLLVDVARSHNVSLIELEATAAGQRLYEQLGFREKINNCVSMEMPLS